VIAANRRVGVVLPAVGAPVAMQNQSSSPMMAGFVTGAQMSHDPAALMPGTQPQIALSQQPMQVVQQQQQQPGSVAQMQVALVCLWYHLCRVLGCNAK